MRLSCVGNLRIAMFKSTHAINLSNICLKKTYQVHPNAKNKKKNTRFFVLYNTFPYINTRE